MAQITLISIYLPLILSLMPFPLIVPDVMEQNIPMFWGKTSGCFGERHPDVLHIKSYTVRG